MRISDILTLKVKDVYGKKTVRILEKKTRKINEMPISLDLQNIYTKRLKEYNLNDFIFESRNKNRDGTPKAITRKTAYIDINEICRNAGIKSNVGCHTLRKTFGYFMYKKTNDFALIMDWLNHSDLSMTKRYIGLDLDTREEAAKNFKF